MNYNYCFEIAAILIIGTVLFDYRSKMRIFRIDSKLFKWVIYVSIAEFITNLLFSLLIVRYEVVPVLVNVLICTLLLVLQASKIYALACFSFAYMNAGFSMKEWGFYVITFAYGVNLILSVTSPLTEFYFYFDEAGRYIQGYGSEWRYFFYLINVLLCLAYVLFNVRNLLKKDIKVALRVAVTIGAGVYIQYRFRSVLTIDIAVAIAILYLYLTLENPNDYQDRLTLCGNEYSFRIFMDQKCNQRRTFTVMFLNLKKFRYINNLYGVDMGDFILRKVALCLEGIFSRQIVFRIHNDLFAVVANGTQDSLQTEVDRLTRRFQKPWIFPDGRSTLMEPAIVLCEYPQFFGSHTELISLRTEMFQSLKDTHDHNVLYSESTLTDKCRRREAVEKLLKQALNEGRLQVYYQPIVNGNSGKVVALEALSRLQDDTLGFIPPDEFITIAESTGVIIQLGFYVLEEVCRFIRESLLTNPQNTVKCVQINLSSLQCAYPLLKIHIMEIIRKYEIPVEMIHMELTESTMLESPKMVRDSMDELIREGISFSLDDYGTGYSNISYLIQFPFDKIKFDKNMVWSYFEKEEAKIIMEKEFDILNTLHKKIVVEGIEQEEQYQEMKSKGITFFQGYYFSKALPKEECVQYLNQSWNK
ncbi:MAG: GGDEF domain-containing phosphodiesterase [Lachnospiraceae bacterium]|nr:GGDEF domain-containing phosphodiesterase [Lachnospiraceae bacterium]